MKKIFSILAAAVIALSFVSCEKNDAGAKYFKIKASVVDSTNIAFKVTPVDTSKYYTFLVLDEATVKRYTQDTIIESYVGYINDYIQRGASLAELEAYGGMVFKGVLQDTIYGVPLNTELVLLAIQLIEENNSIVIGGIATKRISTEKIAVVGKKDLGKFEHSSFYDYRYYDGSYEVYGWNEDEDENYTAYLGLCIYDEDFEGSYDFSDIYVEYSGIWLPEFGGSVENVRVYLVDAKLKATVKDDKGKMEGWVVGTNGIKYSFSVEYEVAEDNGRAPFRIAPKREMTHEGNGILPKIPTLYNRVK